MEKVAKIPPIGKIVLVLSGPTGVGKSDIAIRMGKLLDGEIISCDSVQIYKGLNVGSNKTTVTDGVRHHMIDIVDFWEPFNVSNFYDLCVSTVNDIFERGKVPILVGGTGMYMNWVLNGKPLDPLSSSPIVTNSVDENQKQNMNDETNSIKKEVQRLLQLDNDWDKSLRRLFDIDPIYAASLNKNDYYRLTRALTIVLHSGQSLGKRLRKSSNTSSSHEHHLNWDLRCFYLSTERKYLYRLIDYRCELMVNGGLIDECMKLIEDSHFTPSLPALKSIGYSHTVSFLNQLLANRDLLSSFDSFEPVFCKYMQSFQSESRQYVRKQDTWFVKNHNFKWILRDTPFTITNNNYTCEEEGYTKLKFGDVQDTIFYPPHSACIEGICEFLGEKFHLPRAAYEGDNTLNAIDHAAKLFRKSMDPSRQKSYKTEPIVFKESKLSLHAIFDKLQNLLLT